MDLWDRVKPTMPRHRKPVARQTEVSDFPKLVGLAERPAAAYYPPTMAAAWENAGGTSPRPVIVVPCFNEADRLDVREMERLAASVDLWLVDDGSRDRTLELIGSVAAGSGGRVKALTNPQNLGKAETVRRRLADACAQGAQIVGFLDADLATPVDEMLALLNRLAAGHAEAVTAARVALSGRDIRRAGLRHYTGRIFSTIASLALGCAYYDTQCGAKVFRNSARLRAALAEPFLSRWAFDVELLGRLLAGAPGVAPLAPGELVEYPLQTWHDIAGSKLSTVDAWKAGAELFLIWRDLRRRRNR